MHLPVRRLESTDTPSESPACGMVLRGTGAKFISGEAEVILEEADSERRITFEAGQAFVVLLPGEQQR